MNPKANFFSRATQRQRRPSGEPSSPALAPLAGCRHGSVVRSERGARSVRHLSLMIAAAMLASCADVIVKNPQTGAVETCQQSAYGLDPWSQTQACVADHLAQGWIRVDHP